MIYYYQILRNSNNIYVIYGLLKNVCQIYILIQKNMNPYTLTF